MLLSIVAVCWFDRRTYIYTGGYSIRGNYYDQIYVDFKRIVIGLIVSYTAMQLIHLLAKNNRLNLLLVIGRMSLFVYGFNAIVNKWYYIALHYAKVDVEPYYYLPIIYTTCVFMLSFLLYNLINKNCITRMLFLGK